MPSKAFGFGNRKGAIQRPNTSNTSPAYIRLQKRRAQALELRERGRSYRAIAQELKCSPQTVLNYVVAAMRQTIPKESAQQVLVLEMRRFDSLLAKFYPQALKGDKAAAELVLKIEHQRSRLCGLYPQPNMPLIFNNIGPNDTDRGYEITVIGVRSHHLNATTPPEPPTIEHWPAPPTETKQ